MNPKYRLALLISSLVVMIDQITKIWVHSKMALYQSIEIVPNFFHLTYLRNTGAAFGFLAGERSSLRIAFFILVSAVAIGCIFYLLKNLRASQKTLAISLSLVLGGAIGNLIDRLRLGEVIDFLDFHWYALHWPAFNIADSAITIGVAMLFWQMIRKRSLPFG
ncbi:MAG: signal peptidase II [Deltaproteobacteria bacterium]|nr:signal peptidase II [Deltaproteobacteria bacterium]